ncbi:hypothetical protein [Streptomyces lydicus]|uniref:hypothetical protein n=1 Tax=Streptomyces lydicus TaxID=47763 RepID=UPI003789550F
MADSSSTLAEFLRERIVIGTHEGLAAARARVGGRPTVATEEVIRAARDLLPDPGRSITSIAELLGISPSTLHHHIPGLRELRAGALPGQLEAPAKWPNLSKSNGSGTFCTATPHTPVMSPARPLTTRPALSLPVSTQIE